MKPLTDKQLDKLERSRAFTAEKKGAAPDPSAAYIHFHHDLKDHPDCPMCVPTALRTAADRIAALTDERDAAEDHNLYLLGRVSDEANRAERYRATVRQHWLMGVECDEEGKRDRAQCGHGDWQSEWQPNVGAAVDRYMEHVDAIQSQPKACPICEGSGRHFVDTNLDTMEPIYLPCDYRPSSPSSEPQDGEGGDPDRYVLTPLDGALALGRVTHPEWWRAFDWIEAQTRDEKPPYPAPTSPPASHDEAPNIEPHPRGKLRYDKERRMIVGDAPSSPPAEPTRKENV